MPTVYTTILFFSFVYFIHSSILICTTIVNCLFIQVDSIRRKRRLFDFTYLLRIGSPQKASLGSPVLGDVVLLPLLKVTMYNLTIGDFGTSLQFTASSALSMLLMSLF